MDLLDRPTLARTLTWPLTSRAATQHACAAAATTSATGADASATRTVLAAAEKCVAATEKCVALLQAQLIDRNDGGVHENLEVWS